MIHFLPSLAVLAAGALILSVVYESLAGNRSFSLPLANITLVVLIGGGLFPFWGWTSTTVVLGLYAAWCVIGGLMDRRASSSIGRPRTPLSRAQARELAWREISREARKMEHELVLLDEETMERPWGWVFFYTSKRYLETRAFEDVILGNAPLIVDRKTGQIFVTGTVHPIEYYVSNYEKTGNPHKGLGRVVRLLGFSPGANKVAAIKAVRSVSSLGLAEAKRLIDVCLKGERVDFQISDNEEAEKLVQELRRLGFLAQRLPEP